MIEKKSLKRLNFLVTQKCNLKCIMCDIPKNYKKEAELKTEQIYSILDEVVDLGLEKLEISGGEPMCRKDLLDIIKHVHKKGATVVLITNGTLIGEKEVTELIDAGLSGVMISMEGFKNVNDMIRGKGSFDKAMHAIKHFMKMRNQLLFVGIGVTFSQLNYTSMVPFLDHMVQTYNIDQISVNPFNTKFLHQNNYQKSEELFIDPDKESELYTIIDDLINFREKIVSKGKWMLSESFIRKIPDYFKGILPRPKYGCNAPEISYAIDAEGWVIPCWGDPVYVDTVKNNSLTNIIKSEPYQQFVQKAGKGQCSGCLSTCYYDLFP